MSTETNPLRDNMTAKKEPFAYCYGNSEYGFGRITIELRNYLTAHSHMGDIRIRCSFSNSFEDAYAFEVEHHSHVGTKLDELKVAVKKLEAIHKKLASCNELMGHTTDFAEYARRALLASGVNTVRVDPKFGLSGCSLPVDTLPCFETKDGNSVLNAIGSLVRQGEKEYAKQKAVA
jgi:hypothetical protein